MNTNTSWGCPFGQINTRKYPWQKCRGRVPTSIICPISSSNSTTYERDVSGGHWDILKTKPIKKTRVSFKNKQKSKNWGGFKHPTLTTPIWKRRFKLFLCYHKPRSKSSLIPKSKYASYIIVLYPINRIHLISYSTYKQDLTWLRLIQRSHCHAQEYADGCPYEPRLHELLECLIRSVPVPTSWCSPVVILAIGSACVKSMVEKFKSCNDPLPIEYIGPHCNKMTSPFATVKAKVKNHLSPWTKT